MISSLFCLRYFSFLLASSLSFSLFAESLSTVDWYDELTLDEAFARAKRENKPILLFFTGEPWCWPCVDYTKRYLNHPNFKEDLGDKLIFVKILYPKRSERNTMSKQLGDLKEEYSVQFFPTTLLIDSKTRKEIDRVIGRPQQIDPGSYPTLLLEILFGRDPSQGKGLEVPKDMKPANFPDMVLNVIK